ncbi:transposase family protein [Streptacidiphilus rugosus]|uniref:transposase family protein n=1 Tax=Streptacidiphilus rugosus TaxID=405783 RepID=UPI0006911378
MPLFPDLDAVVYGMSTDWSSGPVEGRVNDLKALKRGMFGRAKPPLLRKRLLFVAYTGAGPGIAVPVRRRPKQELTAKERSLNKAHARLRCPVERGVATVKRWRIFRHARCSPGWLQSAAKAVLTLERQR